MKQETTILKPIFLLLLQGIALFNIFHILSTKEYFTEVDTMQLAFSLFFIMVSSLFTFNMLDKLREEEINKKSAIS